MQLHESIPHIDKLVDITISQQKKDGKWEDLFWNKPLPQTLFGIFTLETLRDKTNIPINESVARATCFIAQYYKEKGRGENNIAGFAMYPKDKKLNPLATAMGIIASCWDSRRMKRAALHKFSNF